MTPTERSQAIASHLAALIHQDQPGLDHPRAKNILARALEPLATALAPLLAIELPQDVALDSVVDITVDLNAEQTAGLAAAIADIEARGTKITHTPPGPMNQPVHVLSDESVTLETFVALTQSINALSADV